MAKKRTWEYEVADVPKGDLLDELNARGRDGWEAYAVIARLNELSFAVFLKRPADDDQR